MDTQERKYFVVSAQPRSKHAEISSRGPSRNRARFGTSSKAPDPVRRVQSGAPARKPRVFRHHWSEHERGWIHSGGQWVAAKQEGLLWDTITCRYFQQRFGGTVRLTATVTAWDNISRVHGCCDRTWTIQQDDDEKQHHTFVVDLHWTHSLVGISKNHFNNVNWFGYPSL